MHAHIEPLTSLIRVFDEGTEFGDPYRYCVTAKWHDRETVELVGTLRAPLPSERRAIMSALKSQGVKRVFFDRRKPGKTYRREINL